MVRVITQVLVGLMLLFGAASLFPKAYFEFKAKKTSKAVMSAALAILALFFSLMAFYYAFMTVRLMLAA
jgi:hypothetical protein